MAAAKTATAVEDESLTWVRGSLACKAGGLRLPQLHRASLANAIRTKLEPGELPRYCLEDAIRVGRERDKIKAAKGV